MSRRYKLNKLLSDFHTAKNILSQTREDVSLARQEVQDAKEAQKILQHAAQATQEATHAQIASIVTHCLQSVFNEAYEFKIIFEQKRGKTEARFVFVHNGEEFDPNRSSAGGEMDVASFALRLAALLLHKPPLRKLLVLDEPMRCLSPVFRPAMAQLLKDLSEELGVQIIMVTHAQEFQTGTTIHI